MNSVFEQQFLLTIYLVEYLMYHLFFFQLTLIVQKSGTDC